MHTDQHLAVVLAAAVLPAIAVEPRETSFDRTLNVTGPVDLEAATHAGSIAVRAGAGGSVRIHGVIRVNRNGREGEDYANLIREIQQNPPIHQAGNSIRIGAIAEDKARRGLSVSYAITVPEETNMRARSGAGAVAVDGLRGTADLSTGAGSVTAVRMGSGVRVRTGSGNIVLDAIRGGVDAHTGSGGIEGKSIAGPIVARTGSGGIRLEETAAAALKAHTGSGGIAVQLPARAGFDVRAHTGQGGIRCAGVVAVRASGPVRSYDGKLRGGGPVVEVSTGSGGIRIE